MDVGGADVDDLDMLDREFERFIRPSAAQVGYYLSWSVFVLALLGI